MKKTKSTAKPAALKRVEGQFAQWRSQKHGRERIPEELWSAAAKVAGRHGINRVSSILRVDYSHLKRRVHKGGYEKEHKGGSDAVFVEIDSSASAGDQSCIIELEKETGVRMRICVRDASAVDWGRMKEAFLGA